MGIGAYATTVMVIFWRPAGIWTIAAAFILGAATYAAFGLLIGVLVRGDLEGFFLIIMISMLDTFLENPVDNPLANKPILKFFPSYAPTQFAAAGAFHHQALASMATCRNQPGHDRLRLPQSRSVGLTRPAVLIIRRS